MMKPIAKRLEKISEQIMGTGENILNKIQFVPKRLSNSSIPGWKISSHMTSMIFLNFRIPFYFFSLS